MLRKITTALTAAALLTGLGLATGGTAQAAPAYPKTYLHTVVDQWTHWSPDADTSSHAGELYAGDNYFYCWTSTFEYVNNGHDSFAWLQTDDDSGNRNVWVSAANLGDADYTRLVNVLPYCAS